MRKRVSGGGAASAVRVSEGLNMVAGVVATAPWLRWGEAAVERQIERGAGFFFFLCFGKGHWLRDTVAGVVTGAAADVTSVVGALARARGRVRRPHGREDESEFQRCSDSLSH